VQQITCLAVPVAACQRFSSALSGCCRQLAPPRWSSGEPPVSIAINAYFVLSFTAAGAILGADGDGPHEPSGPAASRARK
jgi:hypothetical protein